MSRVFANVGDLTQRLEDLSKSITIIDENSEEEFDEYDRRDILEIKDISIQLNNIFKKRD